MTIPALKSSRTCTRTELNNSGSGRRGAGAGRRHRLHPAGRRDEGRRGHSGFYFFRKAKLGFYLIYDIIRKI